PTPAYAAPAAAAGARARAAAYGAWRAEPAGPLPEPSDVRDDDARQLVRAFLARSPHGGWLPPSEVTGLLACYGIPLASRTAATDAGEAVMGVTQEPVFGPLLIFGPGGADSGTATRLAPLTDTDADELIRSAPVPRGSRDASPADLAALRETLLRVSRLADDLPEVAELDLSPVIVRADGVYADGARIRLTPADAHDPFLRKLL